MKTAKQFSKAGEARLLGVIKEMTAHVEGAGILPDEAIAKVASEHDLPRDWVPLMVQAHNHGRSTYQRGSMPNLLEKLAEFPLASTEGVMAILYPSDVLSPAATAEKTATSDEYSASPATWVTAHYKAAELASLRKAPMEKTASAEAIPRDPDCVMTEKFRGISKLAQEVSKARSTAYRTKMAYLAAMGVLADYFKGDKATTFAKHAYWAEQLFGATGKHAMAFVQDRNRMKVAEIRPPAPDGQPITSDREPYNLVKSAIDAGLTMIEARQKEAQAKVLHEQAHDKVYRPFVSAPAEALSRTSGHHDSPSSKEANLFSGLAGGLGFSMARGMQASGMPETQTPDELAGSLMNDLADPSHEQDLRQIQVRTMLTDMLANDEVISGFDPGEVTTAYNEIAQLSPRAATQPAVIRPLLRKRLAAGSVEPFEAQQMADIEKTISQTDTQPKLAGVIHGNPILGS